MDVDIIMKDIANGSAHDVADAAATELGPLEWRVVELARREADRLGRAAIEERGRVARLVHRITGMGGGAVRLADSRLEALRRFVCVARRQDGGMASAAAALAAFGFSAAAIHTVALAATR